MCPAQCEVHIVTNTQLKEDVCTLWLAPSLDCVLAYLDVLGISNNNHSHHASPGVWYGIAS